VHPDAWGFGVAKEAIRAVVKKWFETFPDEEEVIAHVDSTNPGSFGLLKKLGFVQTGEEEYDNIELGKGVLLRWIIKKKTVQEW
jgi:RimJ/RimL family protein N-acetyltransferase